MSMANRLKDHETSVNDVLSMTNWFELRSRLKNIKLFIRLLNDNLKKRRPIGEGIFRIVCIVTFLAKHNLAFPGTNGKLYEDNNGNFLGLVEMLAEFDLVIQEHVLRITDDKNHAQYVNCKIQNEFPHLLLLLLSL